MTPSTTTLPPTALSNATSSTTAPAPPATRPQRFPWLLPALLCAGLAALALGLEHRAQWREAMRPAPALAVALQGQHYRVPAARLDDLRSWSHHHFDTHRTAAHAPLQRELEYALDALFAEVASGIPAFADWYYSLAGEYTRLALLAAESTGLAEPGGLSRQLQRRLFERADFDRHLSAALQRQDEQWLAREHAARDTWLQGLQQRLAQHSPALPALDAADIDLDPLRAQLTQMQAPHFETRLAASGATAAGAALAPTLWQASQRAVAGRGGSLAAGRAASRTAPAAAGSAGLCLAGGAVAPACILAVATASWLATDWALLKLDEARHREQLIEELESALATLHHELLHSLLERQQHILALRTGDLQQAIERSFVPARQWRDTSPQERDASHPD